MFFGLDYTEALPKQMTIETSPTTNETGAPLRTREAQRGGSSWVRGAILGVILSVAVLGTIAWFSTGFGLLRLLGIFGGGRTHLNVDQPTVVHQIQQLQRLETVSYTMDKIISGEHANAYLPKFLAGDRLLLVVHG
jgi:hypothetical protein